MNYMKVHAFLFLIYLVMNDLYYVLSCMYLPYDDVLPCVIATRLKLKETCFGNLCFSNPLKLNL